MGQADLHPERAAEQGQRVIDVVAIADEGDDQPIEAPEALPHREHVGQAWQGARAASGR
jgi:hypothetical protein